MIARGVSVHTCPPLNMPKISVYLISGILCLAAIAGKAQTPNTLLLNANRLAAIKKAWKKDEATGQLVKLLQKQAETLLQMNPLSVMDKPAAPTNGNRHDYISQAPYFWYDSSKPNGLPYINRDGRHNPEADQIIDRQNLNNLNNACQVLSIAWYLTGKEKYAEKASSLLRYWFFNEATKMNPNLNYAQAIPGVNNGRGIGIIESIPLTGIADASLLLAGSKSWSKKDDKLLKSWYSQYLGWMLNSKNGKDEHAAKNNHVTWYLVQVVDFALFTGDTAKAVELAEEGKKLLDNQLEKEGTMPLELVRTSSLSYSILNLQGFFELSTLAEKTGADLWNYVNKKGASLRTAFNWLKPFALGEKPWTYQQITECKKTAFYELLLKAGNKYTDSGCLSSARQISAQANDKMLDLLYER